MNKITQMFGVLLDQWQQATLVDYGHMVLAVVLVGWCLTRFNQN